LHRVLVEQIWHLADSVDVVDYAHSVDEAIAEAHRPAAPPSPAPHAVPAVAAVPLRERGCHASDAVHPEAGFRLVMADLSTSTEPIPLPLSRPI